jgi:diguanylate cyclase (GGDEF)-like protein
MILSPSLPDAHWTDILIESSILLVGIITMLFIRADRMRAASRVIMTGLFFAVALQAYFIGNPANDVGAAMGLQLFAILAILLLDRQDRWIAVFLVIAVFIGLNLLSTSGKILPTITLTPSGKIMFALFIWFSVSIILALVLLSAMGAMRREPELIQQRLTQLEAAANKGLVATDLSYISTHDDMTGLFNRLFFETEFSRLEKGRQFPISIIFTEISGLKEIRETQGAAISDQMRISAARLFSNVFRQEDIVACYTENEFAVLLPNSDESALDVVMERIEKRLSSYNDRHANLPLILLFGTSTTNKGESLKTKLKAAKNQLNQTKVPV